MCIIISNQLLWYSDPIEHPVDETSNLHIKPFHYQSVRLEAELSGIQLAKVKSEKETLL